MVETRAVRKLKNSGFCVEEALRYCANQEEIYISVLQSALQEGREKLTLLENCYERQDAGRYGIEVHGLKNVAQTIGAASLFEIANDQNLKAKAQSTQLWEEHRTLMEEYEKTLDQIEEALKEM